MRTKRYNVLTVAPNSPLQVRNKSSMRVEDIPTSPSVAPLAARQREPSTTPEAPELAAKCIPRYVLSVAKNVKCPLSLEKAGQYIVVSATTRLNQLVGNNLM